MPADVRDAAAKCDDPEREGRREGKMFALELIRRHVSRRSVGQMRDFLNFPSIEQPTTVIKVMRNKSGEVPGTAG